MAGDRTTRKANDVTRETLDISEEVQRLIVRRVAEGAASTTIAAGIALGLVMSARSHPVGADIAQVAARIVRQEVGDADGR